MLVKPAPGLQVRDPHNPGRLVEVGEDVDPNDLDWHRLIRDGDLVECTPQDAAPAVPARVAKSDAAQTDAA